MLGRLQKMALLVLRRVGLCVGQNQMCHLCVWLKLFLKNVRWEKNKKHRVGQRVGLYAVRLYYRFYVRVHLSKWFTFSVYSRLFVVVGSSFTLAANSLVCTVKLYYC